jgi:hypothetical protein
MGRSLRRGQRRPLPLQASTRTQEHPEMTALPPPSAPAGAVLSGLTDRSIPRRSIAITWKPQTTSSITMC